jgi:hypothetical protein
MFLGTSSNPEDIYFNKELLELWLVKNLEVHGEVYLRNYNVTCSMPVHTFVNELQCQ